MGWLKSFWEEISKALSERKALLQYGADYTPRARQVFLLARTEADRLKQSSISTEHLLLGLIKLRQGVAANVLGRQRLDFKKVREEVEAIVDRGLDPAPVANPQFSSQVNQVLDLAQQEAKSLYHTYVGTEHLLLGLLRQADCGAAQILQKFNVGIDHTRQEILRELDPNFSATDSTEDSAQQ